LLRQAASRPFSFAPASTKSSNPANIPMIEVTTSNSISVKPPARQPSELRHESTQIRLVFLLSLRTAMDTYGSIPNIIRA
jgi:hypothetical protein